MLNGFPVSGYDRADGLQGRPGTVSPPAVVEASQALRVFEEYPDSPTIERGEVTTIVHRFKVDLTTGQIYIQGLPRGSLSTDTYGNITKLLSATLQYERGDLWTLMITSEGFGGVNDNGSASIFDVPPDEFSVEPVEFNPDLFRHPRYATVLNYNDPVTGTTGAQIIQWLLGSVNLSYNLGQSDTNSLINSTNITDPAVLALTNELLGELRQGQNTFYLSGFKVTYSYYGYLPNFLNPGGYLEDPVASGNIPIYFWSEDASGSNDSNIFNAVGPSVSPALYDNGLSWLRYADSQQYQRTWFKLTATWIGLPDGVWNPVIYNPSLAVQPPAP